MLPQTFMANDQEASTSNSSNSKSTPKTWKYDIFLSFRGEDTREGFTDHLYHALKRSRFNVFRDDEELPRGEVISEQLKQAIENSNFVIVILSQNYASSSWCLDELQHILYSRDMLCQQVFPIFYDVDPSDVRHQRRSFAEAFAKRRPKFHVDKQKVKKWRDSLTKVANLSGFDSSQYRYETELIDAVVDRLRVQLHSKLPHAIVSDALIGIEWRVDQMLSVLGIGLDDVRFIGLWGMGGVGKTTLARAIYERLHHQFDFHCFLPNVRELSERYDLPYLQNKLLSHLNNKNMHIEDTDEGKNTLGYIFRNKKIMLVLDDVNETRQLENLAGSHEWFGDGSRIIITTRDLHLLTSHEVDKTFEVQPMDNTESLHLFSQKAFRTRVVPDEEQFQQLAQSVVNYTRGLPLALCVLGSFFCGREGLTEWKDALDMMREDSNSDIFKTLAISFNELNPAEKQIFLYIACFFNTWGKEEITQILESCGLPARTGLHTLQEKSLLAEVEIGNAKYMEMHDLVQDMGRLIVIQESPINIGRRSKLWLPDDIDHLLERNMGTEAMEAVVLPHTFEKNEVHWNPEAFLKMCWLRLLIISCNLDLLLHLKGLPGTLKVLHWYGYPYEALPSKENLNQLVYLKLQNSKIKRIYDENDRPSMKNLKILDLSHSKYLVQTPKFCEFQNLKRLILEGCTSLVEIDSSIGQLHFLVEVNLKGCLNLKALPRKLEMNSLEEFVLSGCIQVRKLPEFGKKMKKLRIFDVQETSIFELPDSVEHLIMMTTLQLQGCRNLVRLPNKIYKFKHLSYLTISSCCSKFETLPNQSFKPWFAQIKKKLYSHTYLGTCKSYFQKLNQLVTELDLSYCNIVDSTIPNNLGDFLSLRKLDLSGNEIVSLPHGCISNLLDLQYLYLNSCMKLEFLPQLPPGLNLMDAGECGSLRILSDKKFLHLFASIEQDGQHVERLSITTFSVTIPGSEIPSWFENQNHLSLNEKYVASVTIDMPKEEWLGLGLCTVIDDKICCPRWGIDFRASNGKNVSLPGRTREHEKEIKSCNLWIVFWKIKEENRDELLRNFSQIHLKFSTDWEQQPQSKLVDVESVKFGWHFICEGDLEKLMDDGNTWCSEGEEQEQWNSLSINENSQILMDRCEATSQVASSAFLEEKVKSEDSQMQLITHHACWKNKLSHHDDFPTSTANPVITKSPSAWNYSSSEIGSSSSCCPFDHKEITISTYDSISGTQVPASSADTSGSKQTSAEEIFKELSQVPYLSDTELVQSYILLTENEREYESFKALPTPSLRKLWISTQIKRLS